MQDQLTHVLDWMLSDVWTPLLSSRVQSPNTRGQNSPDAPAWQATRLPNRVKHKLRVDKLKAIKNLWSPKISGMHRLSKLVKLHCSTVQCARSQKRRIMQEFALSKLTTPSRLCPSRRHIKTLRNLPLRECTLHCDTKHLQYGNL